MPPDAEVLLSDDFLDTHCLQLREGSRAAEGLIGLGFSPIRGRSAPDIDGTLWLDPETSELRWLDFRYVNLESGIRDDNVGGRVEFQPLPAGPWIVRRWAIRMPLVQNQRPLGTTEMRATLAGIYETGAQVTEVRDRGGALLLAFETGMVVGSVTSRYRAEPLQGATVQVVGASVEGTTDREGRYRIAGLEDGEYRVTFRHPTVDSLGFEPEPVRVTVVQGQPAVVNFTAPNRWEMLTEVCRGEEDFGGETAALVGWVRELSTGETLPGAEVTVMWMGYGVDVRGGDNRDRAGESKTYIISGEQQGVRATTNGAGLYVVCGVPTGGTVDVQASWGPVEGRSVRIRMPTDVLAEHHDVTIRVGANSAPAADATSVADVEEVARDLGQTIRRRAGPRLRVEERAAAVLEMWFCVQGGRRQEQDPVNSGCSGATLLVDGVIAQEGMDQQGVSFARLVELLSNRVIERARVLTPREAAFELGDDLGSRGAVLIETSPRG